MVVTPSTMLPLGTCAPSFSLPEPSTGCTQTLHTQRRSNGLLVAFLSNHCPFVQLIVPQLNLLAQHLHARNVGMVAIASNDTDNYPQDGPHYIAEASRTTMQNFAYLFDEAQVVAKAFRAACTPDFFLFDADLRLVYRGQLDGARPGNGKPVTGDAIRDAVDKLIKGEPIDEATMRPSIGCNIKWKTGNEPNYAD